eukprot:CAMPEP_0196752234 /NCGR_PEP_ID=MMETSP1091-20130531/86461_1 /TAXON_ID=302021 /ORGANISM="Rhodomonas sp., Strain CCMP768" /LENGTH=168 /DNA_ID=CAMNT_0042100147 /DNA_START=217 /DNA_END=723 /DNA_ORIENTATION=+
MSPSPATAARLRGWAQVRDRYYGKRLPLSEGNQEAESNSLEQLEAKRSGTKSPLPAPRKSIVAHLVGTSSVRRFMHQRNQTRLQRLTEGEMSRNTTRQQPPSLQDSVQGMWKASSRFLTEAQSKSAEVDGERERPERRRAMLHRIQAARVEDALGRIRRMEYPSGQKS